MEFKPKNREWVKNVAIIFLVILLILTFFSNTIMNRSLPEVATQYITDGAITAKVRGTGTVVANGSHAVKATELRDIRAVMVKVGQEVNAGDVLFILGEGDADALQEAQDQLRQLQINYQKAALTMPTFNYTKEERAIKAAQEAFDIAKAAEDAALKALENAGGASQAQIDAAKAKLEAATKAYDELAEKADRDFKALQETLENARATLQDLINTATPENPQTAEIAAAEQAVADAQTAIDVFKTPELDAQKKYVDLCQQELDALLNMGGSLSDAYNAAVAARKAAEENLLDLKTELELQKAADNKSYQLAQLDLSSISVQIERQKEKINELSGGEGNQITANVSGVVQTVDCTAGDTKLEGDILCTIEVPDMGYTLSFSATNEQARRLRVGDSATVSNYYWGSQIVATLSTIKTDPKNPQSSKLLTFDLEGDVNAGSELTISVGSKSANYDTIVPNSAIRSDTNGSFVLVIEAKNSPLGNRYIARRVDIEVLASDDLNSAVTGDISYGSYVITTSNAPVKNGDQVRMADA